MKTDPDRNLTLGLYPPMHGDLQSCHIFVSEDDHKKASETMTERQLRRKNLGRRSISRIRNCRHKKIFKL